MIPEDYLLGGSMMLGGRNCCNLSISLDRETDPLPSQQVIRLSSSGPPHIIKLK